MMTIGRIFPRGSRRAASAQQRLAMAYENLFTGAGSPEDADLVLVDLARMSRFFEVYEPGDMKPIQLVDINGSRRLFSRIFHYINLPAEARDALAEAVRLENAVSNDEGDEI